MQGKKHLKVSKFVIIFSGILIPFIFFFGLLKSPIYSSNTTINLQGKIVRNDTGYEGLNVSAGNPACVVSGSANDTCDFRVRYYDDPSVGTLLLTEEFSNVEIGQYKGVFNISLGSDATPTAGSYASLEALIQGEDDVYVEIGFDPAGGNSYTETFTRMSVQATVYAVRSKYADNATTATGVAFSGITNGTNTSAAMVVGTGASLNYENSGTINASSLLNGTWAEPGAIGGTTASTGAFTSLTTSLGITNNHTTLATQMASTASTATQIPVFTADPSSTTRTLVTRTPAELRSDIGAVGSGDLHDPVTLAGNNYLTLLGQEITAGNVNLASHVTGTLVATNGGTGQASYAVGDLLYASSTTALAKRTIGTADQVLTVSAGVPTWVDASSIMEDNYVDSIAFNTGTGDLTLGRTGSLIDLTQSLDGRYALSGSVYDHWLIKDSAGDTGAQVATTNDVQMLGGTNITTTRSDRNITFATVNDPTFSTSVTSPLLTSAAALQLRPGVDSTTAIQLQNAAGTSILNVDTTNSRIGVGTTSPDAMFSVGATSQFRVDSTGNITRIRDVAYSFPSSQGAANTVLTNDGSGNLTWGAGGGGLWTDGGTFSYLTSTTDDLVFGSSTLGGAAFFFDVDQQRLGIGTSTPQSSIDIAGASSAISNSSGDITITPTENLIISQGNVGVGTTAPQEKLALSSGSNFVIETVTPTGVSTTPTTGGSLTSGTYYYKVVATDGNGYTIGSTEASCTVDGSTTDACQVDWSSVTGAAGYRVYGRVSPQDQYWTTTSTSYTDTGVAGTGGSVPTSTTSYVNKISADGDSWLLGGNVGIGTSSPSQALDLVGSMELEATTTSTTGVIYKGSDRFLHNFKHPTGGGAVPFGFNTFLGINSGNFTMGSTATNTYHSSYNTAVGHSSLTSNTTGYGNSAFGRLALNANTEGYYNTAIGFNALYHITSGYHNTALGYQAGRYITGGVTQNTTSNTSVYIGGNTKALADGGTNEIVIGYNATGIGDNSVVLGNSSIATTALRGDVGIGTTDPNSLLVVQGSSSATTLGNHGVAIRVGNTDTTTGNYQSLVFGRTARAAIETKNVDIANNYADMIFVTRAADGWNSRLYIESAGDVGIGQTSPDSKLHVKGDVIKLKNEADSTASFIIDSGSTTTQYSEILLRDRGSDIFSVRKTTGNAFQIYGHAGSGTAYERFGITNGSNSDVSLATTGTGNFYFKNSVYSGNTMVTITDAGRMGVGTTGPVFNLQATGGNVNTWSVPTIGVTDSTDAFVLTLADSGSNNGIFWDSNRDLRFGTAGSTVADPDSTFSEKMRITSTGNVGIGTTSPIYNLSVTGQLGPGANTRAGGGYGGIDFTNNGIGYPYAAKIYTFRDDSAGEYYGFTNDYDGNGAQLSIISKQASGNIAFYTGNPATRKMSITSGGNVGIGTTSPGQKLHVAGNLQVDGAITAPEGTLRDDGGGWMRTYGNTGWYSQTYGGGWYMIDTTWIRAYGSKPVYSPSTIQSGSNMKAPIYYDLNNTGYYLDPSSTETSLKVAGNVGIRTTSPSGVFDIYQGSHVRVRTTTHASSGSYTPDFSLEVFGDDGGAGTSLLVSTAHAAAGSRHGIKMKRGGLGGGGDTEFRCDWAGRCYADGGWNGAADFAEYFWTEDLTLEKGDLVTLTKKVPHNTPNVNMGTIQAAQNSDEVLGVISTNPGFVGMLAEDATDNEITENITNGEEIDPHYQPVGLLGQVPVKVTNLNGKIKLGDPINLSSLPKYGAKATKTGQIVGRATQSTEHWNNQTCPVVSSLDDINWPNDKTGTNKAKPCFRLPDGTYVGKIMVYVNVSWYDPKPGELLERIEELESQLDSLDTEGASMLSIDSNIEPAVNNTYDIGTNEKRWKDIYAQGTINLGNEEDSGSIKYDTETKELKFTNDGENWIAVGPPKKSVLLSAQYPGSVIPENADVKGVMTTNSTDIDTNSMNYYEWVSSKSDLNTKEIKIRYQIPSDFKQWGDGGITFKYATQSIDEEENKLDFYVYDQASEVPETISLDHVSSVEEEWDSVEVLGLPFNKCNTPGDVCMFVIEMSSSKDYYTRVGDVEIRYERNL